MRVLFFAVLLALAFGDDDNGIIELTEDNFLSSVKDGDVWAVAFYSPTCGFCKMIEGDWEKFAKEVAEDELPINVARINVKDSPHLSKEHKVGRLPGIKVYRDGEVYTLPEPRNGRSADEYIEWALETYEEIEQGELDRIEEEKRKQAEIDAASDLVFLDEDNFDVHTSEGVWLIEFYGPECGYCKKLAPLWEELGHEVNPQAESMGFKVAKVDAHAGFKWTRVFKANPWPAIKLLKDNKVYTFPEPRNFDMEVEDYIEFAQGGWEDVPTDEIIEVDYIEAAKKRIARKAKYKKMKEKAKAKKAAKAAKKAAEEAAKKHDEL